MAMAEFDEKLNAILGNQEAMGQIMALARSLSGGSGDSPPPQPKTPEPTPSYQPACGQEKEGPSLFDSVDPALLQLGMRLLQEYQGNNDRNAALLAALRPFLREERRAHLDRAMELTRMTRLIRTALGAMGGKGAEVDV